MQGFSNRFADFPAYIIDITKEIWEDRGLSSSMKEFYHPDCVIRTPAGIAFGEPGMTQATIETLHELPDRVLMGEDVIWSGTPEDGMLSSHRIISQATHTGSGQFGPATGRKVQYRALADCYAKDNQISDEWLVRDNGAMVRQMGSSPQDWVRWKIESEGGMEHASRPFTPEVDQVGPYTGHGNDNPWGATYADHLTRIMSGELSVIPEQYDRAVALEYPGGVSAHGHAAADQFWLGLRASFASSQFKVHHVIGREDPMMPPRAAVRWSLWGKHDGWGAFGAPSGAMVYVMGISQAEFGPWGLRREYTLYDETAIWKQIILAQG